MVHSHHLSHLLKLVAVVLCVHRYWPKGILYSDREKTKRRQQQQDQQRHKQRQHRGRSRTRETSRSNTGARTLSNGGSDRYGRRSEREFSRMGIGRDEEYAMSAASGSQGQRRRRRSDAYYHADPPRYEAKGSYFYDL